MVPEVPVLFLTALVDDDGVFISKLLRRFPLMRKAFEDLSGEERLALVPDPYSNYFYVLPNGSIGLVATPTSSAQSIAKDAGVEELIYWGTNTDPVSFATVYDVAQAMCKSDVYVTPSNVLKVLVTPV